MEMFADEGAEPIAASEQMLLHVDTTNGAKSAAFDADIASRIQAMFRDAPKEARYAGRVIGLPSGPRATTSTAASASASASAPAAAKPA